MGVLKTLAGYDAICGIRINSSSLSRVTVGVRRVSFSPSRKDVRPRGTTIRVANAERVSLCMSRR